MNLCASCGKEITEDSLCPECEEKIRKEVKNDERE